MSNEKEKIEESGTIKEKINQILSFDDLVSKNKIISKDNKLHKPEVGSEETDGESKDLIRVSIVHILGGFMAMSMIPLLYLVLNMISMSLDDVKSPIQYLVLVFVTFLGFISFSKGSFYLYKGLKQKKFNSKESAKNEKAN